VKIISGFLCAAIVFACAERTCATVLYGSTAGSGAGELYTLDPTNGAVVTDIGPLNDASTLNYGVTGLAFEPTTQTLYGSTGNSGADDPSTRAQLVRINPANGLVTPIGPFNVGAGNTMTDISFDPTTGTLYGIGSSGGAHLYTVNTLTGQATLVGDSGFGFTTGGGMAINSAGMVYGSPNASNFGTYDKNTGSFVLIGNPGPDPDGGRYVGMSFDGATLYSATGGFNITTHLVTIDTGSGAVTDLGTSVSRLDGIAFPTPEPTSLATIGLAFTALAARRRRGKPSSC
jgi:hypothetical protein